MNKHTPIEVTTGATQTPIPTIDNWKVCTNLTPNIEGIVESFEIQVAEALGYKLDDGEWKTYDFYGNLERLQDDTRLKDIVKTFNLTLQSQADEYEREKGEMVREMSHMIEMKVIRTPEGKWDENEWNFLLMIVKDDITRIVQKYGVDLSE